jgi:accessory gene regulator protein AgrB
MIAAQIIRHYGPHLAGTAIGSWLCMRVQFGLQISPNFTEELALFGIAIAVSVIFVALFVPTSLLLERRFAAHATTVVSSFAVLVSIALGLWVYVNLLHRPLALVVDRDLPYVLCFALTGIGYSVAYSLQRRIQPQR